MKYSIFSAENTLYIAWASFHNDYRCCWFCLHDVLLFTDDWSSISSNASSLVGGEGNDVFTPNKPHTSNPTLHVHTLGDLEPQGQGHHRRGSSGDKIKIQISQDFRNELADRQASTKGQQRGLFRKIF